MNQTIEPEVIAPGAIESITRGEVDISISTARKYPRQPAIVKSTLLGLATLDEETATGCFYSLPRGGKNIQGPSVRLAELALSAYGNVSVGCRIISVVSSGESPHVVIQAVAHDLQTNSRISLEKRRRIVGKRSKGGVPDEDDTTLAVNACTAIAFRDCVLKIVPQVFIKPAFEAAKKVAIGDARTLTDRRNKSIETFAKMGVPAARVLAKLEKKTVEEIGLDDLETLIGLHNAIRDNEVTIDEAFPLPKAAAPAANPPPAPPAATQTQAAATPAQETKAAEPASTPAAASPPAGATETRYDITALSKAKSFGLTEAQCLRYLQSLKPPVARSTNRVLSELSDSKLINFIAALDDAAVVEEIKKVVV